MSISRGRVAAVFSTAHDIYKSLLSSSDDGKKEVEKWKNIGVGPEVLRAFEVGYSPSAGDMILCMQSRGFTILELVDSGLLPPGGIRPGLSLPIFDPSLVVGFGRYVLDGSGFRRILKITGWSPLYSDNCTLFSGLRDDRVMAQDMKLGGWLVRDPMERICLAFETGSAVFAPPSMDLTRFQVGMIKASGIREITIKCSAFPEDLAWASTCVERLLEGRLSVMISLYDARYGTHESNRPCKETLSRFPVPGDEDLSYLNVSEFTDYVDGTKNDNAQRKI